MLIYAIMKLKPDVDVAALAPHGKTEAAAVWAEIAADVFRRVSLRVDAPGAVVELEVPDVAAARSSLARLPLVAQGLVDVEYIPVGPYKNLATLFAG